MKIQALATNDTARVWRQRIDVWLQSGLSQKAFCARNQLALSSFGYWRQRLKSKAGLVPACVEIVPVARVHEQRLQAPPIVVVVGGGRYRLEVADGFQRETLQEVLQALEVRG